MRTQVRHVVDVLVHTRRALLAGGEGAVRGVHLSGARLDSGPAGARAAPRGAALVGRSEGPRRRPLRARDRLDGRHARRVPRPHPPLGDVSIQQTLRVRVTRIVHCNCKLSA